MEITNKTILPPTHCPSCEGQLTFINDLLYCLNDSCTNKNNKKIEHFCKTMKIKGLGPKTIETLELEGIEDLYTLSVECLESGLGSTALAIKIKKELTRSLDAPLNLVLPALGIKLVGKTAADKLASVCDSIEDISEETCRKAGLGPQATNNLINYLEQERPQDYLPFNWKFDKPVKKEKGVICISGKLKSFKTKSEATQTLEALGFTVKSSVTKDTNYLVNEGGIESAKTKKARESGITIIENLKTFIGE